MSVHILQLPAEVPSIAYVSGLTVYQERFTEGVLSGRWWSASGRIKPDWEITQFQHPFLHNFPFRSFELTVDGQALNHGWSFKGMKQEEEGGNCHGIIELSHHLRPIALRVHTLLDGTPFIVRWLEITNTGEKPCSLTSIAVWSGILKQGSTSFPQRSFTETPFHLGRFTGNDWAEEGRFIWEPLMNGIVYHLGSFGPYGTSGYQCPFFILRNELSPLFFIFHLAWSGTWKAEIQSDAVHYKMLRCSIGPSSPPPMRVIQPGETIRTPSVHIGHCSGTFNECVQSNHQHIRHSVVPPNPRISRPLVEYNTWASTGVERMSEERLLEEVEIAARVGSEAFVVDAGWYGKGPARLRSNGEYTRFMGDWVAGEWLPRDLDPVIQKVHQKGMLFGLWIEPEGIGTMSEIYQQHPEWMVSLKGKPVPPVAARVNLDYSNPEVAAWIEQELTRLVERYKLDILRIDGAPMAVELGERETDGFLENTMWRHYEVLYQILDRLQSRYPRLMIENCCGGGGRNDLGMLSRTHWAQLTDEWRPPRTIQIVNGMSMMLPPELGMLSFGIAKVEQEALDTSLRILLFGRFTLSGLGISQEHIQEEVLRKVIRYVNFYKEFVGPMLPTCKVYHHTPIVELDKETKPDYCVLEYASQDASRAIVGIFKLTDTPEPFHFHPKGLDSRKKYTVTFDNTGQTMIADGGRLQQEGLRIFLERALQSELLIFNS